MIRLRGSGAGTDVGDDGGGSPSLLGTHRQTDYSSQFELESAVAWQADANCYGMHPAEADWLFFNQNPPLPQIAAICQPCPVRVQCLALGKKEDAGFFGGKSATQRRSALQTAT